MRKQLNNTQRSISVWQLRAGYALVLFILVFGSVASFFLIQRSAHNAEKAQTKTTERLAKTNELLRSRTSVSNEFREFLITGNQTRLARRNEVLAEFDAIITELIRDEPASENKEKLIKLKEISEKSIIIANKAIRLKQRGASTETIKNYFKRRVVPAYRELDEHLSAVRISQVNDSKKADRVTHASVTRLKVWTIMLSTCALLLSSWIAWIFSERQIRAVKKLDDTILKLQKTEAELQKRNSELVAAVHSRDEMVGVISHELKNPLSALQLSTTLMQRLLPKDQSLDSIRQQMERIKPSIYRMNQLISDLLDVTRLEAKSLKLAPRVCDLVEIAQEVVKAHEAVAQDKLVQLHSDVPPECRNVFCDPDRTAQILNNLVNNALKFTNSGGSVSISAKKSNQQVEIRVIDTGKGIPKENLPHVFDRFWQEKETAHKGTGLGLSIAKGLVEAQGGKLWVESQPGYGTTFYFTLPLAERLRAVASHEAAS